MRRLAEASAYLRVLGVSAVNTRVRAGRQLSFGTMLILGPHDLARCDARSVEEIAARRDFAVAAATGEVRGYPLAAAFFCDWLALADDSIVELDCAAAWAGAAWRIGRRALRLHLMTGHRLTAAEALREGLADAIVPRGEDPVKWIARWIGGRSTAALDSAAALISRRGGDALERAEFARLFATGEPQEGLNAFLGKRQPAFGRAKAKPETP